MIVRLRLEDIEGEHLKGEYGGKEYNFSLWVDVNETNISKAVSRLSGNKKVDALIFTGSLDVLRFVKPGDTNVVVYLDSLEDVGDFITKLSWVRFVVRLSGEYKDMKELHEYSTKYRNIYFCGGDMLRLKGLNLGCSDFTLRKHSKQVLLTEGCVCSDLVVGLGDLDKFEFSSETIDDRIQKQSKRNLSSIIDLMKNVGDDNF